MQGKAKCVAIIVQRGQDVLVERIAPVLRVVREPGKPPRVEVDADRTADAIAESAERQARTLAVDQQQARVRADGAWRFAS